jgi:exodeoxyribonuclease VII small subunit
MAKGEARRPTGTKGLEGKSFEEVLKRLEEIVEGLEAGDLTVEKSLALFEEGVGLAREGHRRLESAEKRITALLEEGGERPLALDGVDEDSGDDEDDDDAKDGAGDDDDE